MKRWQFIISLSILLVLVCCKHPHEPLLLECQGFNEVFEKRDAYPDSALAIFRNIQDTIDLVGMYSRSPQQFFDYQVLNAELVYKNDQTILNDSLVLEAAEFYDSIAVGKRMAHKQLEMDFMRARAYYYAGVVKVQREQYIEALEHYLSVLRIMDKLDNDSKLFSRSEKNAEYLHFTGLTFNRIGWVFYVNDLWDEVKEALELANERFRLEGEVGGMLSNYAVLGEIMLTKGNREAATEYYRLADSLNNIMVSRPDCIDCELNMALLAYAKGQKQEAYEILYEIMSQNEDLSTSEELGFHIGRFYYEDHAYDSALHYLGDGFQKFSYQTMASLEMIIAMCDSLGYEDKVAYYSQCLARVSLGRIAQLREGSKLSLLFDSYLKERDNSRKNRYIYLVISFLVLAFVTLVIVDYVRYRIRKKRYKTDSEAYEKQRLSLEREIEKAQEVAMQQEEKIKSMEAELLRMIARREVSTMTLEERVKVLEETPIGKRMCAVMDANVKAGVAYPEMVLSRNQFAQLVNAVDTVFPKFSSRIIEMYPRLKYSDVVYCCLYILGLTEVQAAAITGKTYQAVWMRSGKLHEIFESKSDLRIVLFEILKNW